MLCSLLRLSSRKNSKLLRINDHSVFQSEKRTNFFSVKDKYSCTLSVIIILCNNPVTVLIRAPDKRGY